MDDHGSHAQSVTVKDIHMQEKQHNEDHHAPNNNQGGHGHGHSHGSAEHHSIKKKVLDKVEKVLMINQFAKGPQLDCKDESNLKKYEPENDKRGLT